MGRLRLILRLAGRDLRRRPVEAVLVLLVVAAATTTLTIGLALHGVTDHPYEQTRAATAGPDVIATLVQENGGPADPAAVAALTGAPGVTGHAGPYPLRYTSLTTGGRPMTVAALGRDTGPGPIDRPKVIHGHWVRPGQLVLERAFADAIGAHIGDTVTLGGHPFVVGGTAVSAALPAYPSSLCHIVCFADVRPGMGAFDIGLVWLTTADSARLTGATPMTAYLVDLRLADPASAPAFAAAHDRRPSLFVLSWTDIQGADAGVTRTEQAALQVGGVLLALLALAALTVLAGRRLTDQTRRVGLLKAVGGGPVLITAVLLVEHLTLAVLAATGGLVLGHALAGRFTDPGDGLLGAAGTPMLTGASALVVLGTAVLVALIATAGPALRAGRTTTITALHGPSRTPRRSTRLIAVSARLPGPLLLGLRLIGRRPSRALLSVLSVTVTAAGLVTLLISDTVTRVYTAGLHNPRAERLTQVTVVITVMLLIMAAVTTVFTTWATVADARHHAALARAFGSTPAQVGAGLAAAQVVPAVGGVLLGTPLGILLYRTVTQTPLTLPPAGRLLALLAAIVLAVAACTALPARLGARRPIADILAAE
ncbi:FtsX-like permease family protein [Actinoplanes sp. CA-030573]|uniref:FtsX-like permease family protein n=1 Tax=Actinoplanes sp. CA-030573 TaxID=3239898 RepID=UPI003D913CB6